MSNRSKTIYTVLFLLLLLLRCSPGQKAEDIVKQSDKDLLYSKVAIKQVDSLMVDILGKFVVYDYNSRTGHFLAGDIGFGGYNIVAIGGANNFNKLGHLIIDAKGRIISQNKHTDNGPEGHGGTAVDHFFMSDSTYGVLSKLGLFEYTLNGNFVKKYKELNTLDFIGYPIYDIGAVNSERKMVLGLAKGLNEAGRAWDSLYQIVKPLHFYDLDQFKTGYEPLDSAFMGKYGFPVHELFAPHSKYNVNQSPPRVAFNAYTNEAYALYPELPRLEAYDMSTGKLNEYINLEPEHFGKPVETGKADGGVKGFESILWLNRGGRMASSNYHDLIQLGDYTLTRYNKAIPLDEVNKLVATGGYRNNESWPSIRRQHYGFYYQLLKDGKKVVSDFTWSDLEPKEGEREFNSDRMTHGTIVGGDGLNRIYVLMPNEGDEERDYELIRVYELTLSHLHE